MKVKLSLVIGVLLCLFAPVNPGVAIAPLAAAICGIWLAFGAAGTAAIAALTGGTAAAALMPILSAGATSYSSCMILVGGIAAITCFDENAMIKTPYGSVPIHHLTVGDKLDDNAHVMQVSTEQGHFTFLEVVFEMAGNEEKGVPGAVNVTANHVMLVKQGKGIWMKPALYLTVGEQMMDSAGNPVVIRKINSFTKSEKVVFRTSNGLAVVNQIQTTALCDITPFEKVIAVEKEKYFEKYHETLIFQ